MESPSACLEDVTVLALLGGSLPAAQAQSVEDHLAGCPACRELVSALARSSLAIAVGETTPQSPSPGLDAGLGEGAILAGRYRLLRRLGEGGMGSVWAALHLVTQREVAVKIAKRLGSERERSRFLREARVAAALEHPGIVPVRDAFDLDDGTPVLVMDLLRGESLREHLLQHRSLSLDAFRRLALPLVEGLAAAHARGVVHRDLKPENIFLVEAGEGASPTVRILDFGIAKIVTTEELQAAEMTRTGEILGTPYYMAPEQAFGEPVDQRVDLWALGVVFYECLSGERPFSGDNLGQLLRALTVGIHRPLGETRPELPGDLVELIERLLSVDRARRPDTAQIIAALTGSGRARPARWPAMIALGAALGGLVVIGVRASSTPSPATIPGPAPVVAAPPAEAPAVTRVALRLALDPPDAEVTLDGVSTTDNPLRLLASAARHELVVSAPGRVTARRSFVASVDGELEVKLPPAPRAPHKQKGKAPPGPMEQDL
jgi:serine/threonine-protein kinase